MDYDHNSFDRFGDDLCEVILSYLPLNDCFQYECVSKQWKRLIFNKQNKLVVKKYNTGDLYRIKNLVTSRINQAPVMSNRYFNDVLKKCRFISDLRINVIDLNDDIMDTISNYCQHLKIIECNADTYNISNKVTKSSLELFAAKCGQKIEVMLINCEYNQLKLLVNAMPNLKIIRFDLSGKDKFNLDLTRLSNNSPFITSANKPVLPKLEQIDLGFWLNVIGFESFVDMYGKQIKSLTANIIVYNLNYEIIREVSINNLLAYLNRFENLEKLHLDFDDYNIDASLESDIRLIGEKCAKLIDLQLDKYHGSLINCFANNFVSLRKLQISSFKKKFDGGVECLKSCIHLTHLSLEFVEVMDEDFSEINANLPKLEYLQIFDDCKKLTDNTLRSVAKLKQLYCFNIYSGKVHNKITNNGICYLINNCASIKCIEIDMKTRVSKKSVIVFIEKAKQFPKIEFHFSARVDKPNRVIIKDTPKNFYLKIIS